MDEQDPETVPLRPVPDLGGVPVSDAGGQPIGRVFGSLAEADTGLIRYLDLSLEKRVRHVLVPIGHVRVSDGRGPAVRLRAAVLSDLEGVPTYNPENGPPAADEERELLAAHGRLFYGDRYYAHPAYDHSGLYAGEHPIVRGTDDMTAQPIDAGGQRLVLLSRSDYRVARGEPDITGWPLMSDADLPSGTVSDLIADVRDELVRYVVVELRDGGFVLLPVGFLQVDSRAGVVRAPGLRHDDLVALPRFEIAVDRELEERVRAALRERLVDRRRYALPDFGGGRRTDRRRA